jgi:hypothetical protein
VRYTPVAENRSRGRRKSMWQRGFRLRFGHQPWSKVKGQRSKVKGQTSTGEETGPRVGAKRPRFVAAFRSRYVRDAFWRGCFRHRRPFRVRETTRHFSRNSMSRQAFRRPPRHSESPFPFNAPDSFHLGGFVSGVHPRDATMNRSTIADRRAGPRDIFALRRSSRLPKIDVSAFSNCGAGDAPGPRAKRLPCRPG